MSPSVLWIENGWPMIWPTVWRGLSDEYGSWKTICISRRTGRMSRWLRCVMSRPSKRIVPAVGSSSLSISRAVVDLPQPDSPTMPSVSPLRTLSVTSSTACTSPERRENTPVDDREALRQALDLDQRVAHGCSCADPQANGLALGPQPALGRGIEVAGVRVAALHGLERRPDLQCTARSGAGSAGGTRSRAAGG